MVLSLFGWSAKRRHRAEAPGSRAPSNHARSRSEIAYRPDIDGLRAVAVLAVLLFHLQIRYALGGFTGVDVFFVISGYLISSILLGELDTGRFRLGAFYVRRIRRIYPALIAAMAGTSALALVFCFPSELRDFARSLIAASLSCANLYFGVHSGYFDPRNFNRPALQTWSLGVEEQFYLLFPPLLAFLHRRLRRPQVGLVLAGLTAGSFALSVAGAYRTPAQAFFMPWTRACELGLGVLLAAGVFAPTGRRWLREAAAGCGAVLLLGSFLLLNGAVPFPGWAVLGPCGGAALLVWSGMAPRGGNGLALPPPTVVGRLLGTRPLVGLGLISYSLYLVHWPLIVFQGLSTWGDELPHRAMKSILVALSLLLAWASWRWVERPFRDGRLRLQGRAAFLFAGASSAVLVAAAFAVLALGGLPGRFPAAAVAVGSYVDEPLHYRVGTCMVIRARDFRPDPCLVEDPDKPNWLLIGDSHAAAEWLGLAAAYPGVHWLEEARASCRPDPTPAGGDCGALNRLIFTSYLPHHPIGRMVVEGRWAETDIPAIGRLVAWCQSRGIPLTLIGPTQDYDAPLPRLLALGILRHDPGLANRHRIAATAALDARLAQLARDRWHVPYISLVEMVCGETRQTCETYVDPAQLRVPLLVDEDHLSNEGSLLLGARIRAEGLLPER